MLKNKIVVLIVVWLGLHSCTSPNQPKNITPQGQVHLSFGNPFHNTYSNLVIELDNDEANWIHHYKEDIGDNFAVFEFDDVENKNIDTTRDNTRFKRRVAIPTVSQGSYKIRVNRGHRSDSASIYYLDDMYVLKAHSEEITFKQDTILKVLPNNVWLFFRYQDDKDTGQIDDFERMIFTVGCVPNKMRPGNYGHFVVGGDSLPINREDHQSKILVKTYAYSGELSELSRMQKSFNTWHDHTVRAYMSRWDGVVP